MENIENNLLVAVCQMKVTSNKTDNLTKAEKMITKASQIGAEMVVLPEIFNSPYQSDLFPAYAEYYPGPTTEFLAQQARENQICLVGGSIPEKDKEGRIFNTSFSFDHNGRLLGRHRKVHLFDIDIPGKITFKESSTLSSGDNITVINYKSFSFAVMICYDCRFPELARAAVMKGAKMIIIPAAFNLTTGPAHWELLMRMRAVDNQVYVVASSPARNPEASYQVWGHSMVVDPWGTVIKEAGIDEEILLTKIDFSMVDKIRTELPVLKQRRTDLYQLKYK